ncbi:MAG: hypothetical protein CMF42_03045 [Legionellales bacterium]|nr:hypothetical protein [Legionellales bacterium]OUX67747.1 MAG: hypothetical protein CBD38_01910 [bacterium TMED178]
MKSILLVQPSQDAEQTPLSPPLAGAELGRILARQAHDSRLQLLKKGNTQYIYMMDDRLTNQPLQIDLNCQEVILSKNTGITKGLSVWLYKKSPNDHFIIVPPNQEIDLIAQTNIMIIHNKASLDRTLAPNQMTYSDLLDGLATEDLKLNSIRRAQLKTLLFSGDEKWDNFRTRVMHVMAKIYFNRHCLHEVIGEIIPILKYEGLNMNEIIHLLQLCNVNISFEKDAAMQEQEFIHNVVSMMNEQGYSTIEIHQFLSAMNLHAHPVCRKISHALQAKMGIEQVFSVNILKFLRATDVNVLFTVLNSVTHRSPNMTSMIPRSIYSLFSEDRQADPSSKQLTIGY